MMDRLKKELEEWREKARELRTTVDTLKASIYKDSKLLASVRPKFGFGIYRELKSRSNFGIRFGANFFYFFLKLKLKI